MTRSGARRVVIAPDEFGGTLTARAAASAIAQGWGRERPGDRIDLLPQSDGGPGFVDVLAAAGVGRLHDVPAFGPVGEPVDARLLLDGDSAYVESAQVCGLHLLGERGPDPTSAWTADSAGLGTLLAAAVDAGARRIVVGLGGTATTDGGRGACDRLGGWDAARTLLADVDLLAATDVTNPLLGPTGAAAVFGPQKGLEGETIERADAGLARLAEVLGRADLAETAGAGAAGGTGFALLVWGASLVPGSAEVAELTGIAADIAGADLVVTGEGRYDGQSEDGKAPAHVAALARAAGVPVAIVAGAIDGDVSRFSQAVSLTEVAGSTAAALADPQRWLRDAGEILGRA